MMMVNYSCEPPPSAVLKSQGQGQGPENRSRGRHGGRQMAERIKMNEISHEPAQTVAELASARQHQRPGRPSWSARWRVDKQPTHLPAFFGLTAPGGRGGPGCFIAPTCCSRHAIIMRENPANAMEPGKGRGGRTGRQSPVSRVGAPLSRANSDIFKVRDFACYCGSKYVPSM